MMPAFHPDKSQQLGNVSPDGRADNYSLQYVVDQVLRGIAAEKAKQIKCFDNGKVITLEQLLTNQHSEINWPEQKQKINKWLNEGMTLESIARKLGVSKSTLSMANRKHRLYHKKSGANVTRLRAIEHRQRRIFGGLAECNLQSNTLQAEAFNDQGDIAA